MSTLVVAALTCVSVWGCAAAVADTLASPRASIAIQSNTPSPLVSAAQDASEALLVVSWASETATYADLLAADEAVQPTAVYDIMGHVVVMPDGTRLEAHSGLHERADDPRFVAEHMRGSTPPALYDLAPRKRPFHGVAALRLKLVAGDVFGRTGLLAHTYMLHGRPESNGCVVFRDYGLFLNAFRTGRIKRLRVVPSVGDAGARIDMARAMGKNA